MKDTRGFTLLELLMVVVIVGILAAVALPQYLNTAERSRAAEAYGILGAIRAAELRFRSQDTAGNYGALAALDVTMPPNFGSWNAPAITGVGATTGFVTMSRNGGGPRNLETIGLQFGSGTRCGTFVPEFPVAVVCAAD